MSSHFSIYNKVNQTSLKEHRSRYFRDLKRKLRKARQQPEAARRSGGPEEVPKRAEPSEAHEDLGDLRSRRWQRMLLN